MTSQKNKGSKEAPPAFVLRSSPRAILCFNGNIHTLDPDNPRVSVLASRGQELVYAGRDRAEAERLLGAGAEKLDLKGCAVIPGLTDGHAHLLGEGLRLAGLDLSGKSRMEIEEIVRREAAEHPAGQWICGHGWNQEDWPDRAWPDKTALDALAPDHPVVLDRLDKHSIWVNSRAMEFAGITENSASPPGGEIMRDASGRLQGILVGSATRLVRRIIPSPDAEGLRQAFLRAQAEFLGYGLTSLMEASSGVTEVDLFRQAGAEGDLKLRLRVMLRSYDGQDKAYLDLGGRAEHGLYGERLSIAGVKIMADGSLGSRSARLFADYTDSPGRRGDFFHDPARMREVMTRARDNGLIAAVHAIGDEAAHWTLEAMRDVLGPRPGDHRWRIEHAQILTEEDRNLILALGVVPSIQTVSIISDLDMAEDRLGAQRILQAYAWRDLLDQGTVLVNGSDCPIQTPNPFAGMHAAVTRTRLDGFPPGGWYSRHRLSREEALRSYTTWAAWSEFGERRKGSIQAGKLADFVVLDRDFFSCPEDEIQDIQVKMTISGGEIFSSA